MSKKVKSLDTISDSELVVLIRGKHPEAFAELISRYEKRLFSYIFRFIRGKEETEDVLQNVFVKVYVHLNDFDVDRKFSSWIYRICHNEAINYLKKRNRKRMVSWEDLSTSKDKLEASSPDKTPEEEWVRKEIKMEINEALQKLPEKYREILVMRYYKDASYDQMSRSLKKPINTVGTLLSRAKKKLSRVVKKNSEKSLKAVKSKAVQSRKKA